MLRQSNATQVDMKDLIALKARAEAFILPTAGKKSMVGFGSTYSPFKSRGLDFQEVRVYQPGDDIRQIDWHVTAKYGKPFTKLYTEEKERTIFFVVDLRSNMCFATHGDFKQVVAARMAAFMAFIAEHQKDKIGYILLMDDGLVSGGRPESNGMLTPFLNHMVLGKGKEKLGKDFNDVIRLISQFLPAGSFVFLFSDFYDWTEKNGIGLGRLSDKNTLLLCPIYDELEADLPKDILPFSNGRETVVVSAVDDKIRTKFHKEWAERMSDLKKQAQKYAWGFLPLRTDSDYINELCHFCFQRKER